MPQEFRVLNGIPYKTADNTTLHLDLYIPDSPAREPLPVVVYFHGGGWSSGDRADMGELYKLDLSREFLARGFALASVDYRLTSCEGLHFPAPVEDCKDALRWLHMHGAQYNLNPDAMGLWGTSAGGHLAMLAAWSADQDFPGDPALAGAPVRVRYVLNNYGPADLGMLFKINAPALALELYRILLPAKHAYRQARIQSFTGPDVTGGTQGIGALCTRYSPTRYAAPNGVPTLTFHGTADQTVSPGQAKFLHKVCLARKHPHQLVLIRGTGHNFRELSAQDTRSLIDASVEFALKHTGMKEES